MWTATELKQVFPSTYTTANIDATGISIDSRTVKKGDIFFAIKGETTDGHLFVKDAVDKGASYLVVEALVENIPTEKQIIVSDTLKALEELAKFCRHRTKAKVIGITGSVGKTTVKELLAHILKNFGKTVYSKASYNNHIGVPFTLSHLEADTQYGVIEMGMNNPGEIAPLSLMAQPDIAIVTAIAPSHIGHMGSLEAIAEEKSDIFKGVSSTGTVIMTADTGHLHILRQKAESLKIQNILTFGEDHGSNAKLTSYTAFTDGSGADISALIYNQSYTFPIYIPGKHSALNAMLALFTCINLGLKAEEIIPHISSFMPVQGRGERHKLNINGSEILLIDDAYNANPASMRAGLAVLATTAVSEQNRRIAVLGDMKELGEGSINYHRELSPILESLEIDLVFAAGTEMKHLYDALPSNMRGGFGVSAEDIIPMVRETLKTGDIVFVKGSKSSYVSKVVDDLKKAGALI